MNHGVKSIYLHKLKFNVELVEDDGLIKTFLQQVGMWIIIHYFEQ